MYPPCCWAPAPPCRQHTPHHRKRMQTRSTASAALWQTTGRGQVPRCKKTGMARQAEAVRSHGMPVQCAALAWLISMYPPWGSAFCPGRLGLTGRTLPFEFIFTGTAGWGGACTPPWPEGVWWVVCTVGWAPCGQQRFARASPLTRFKPHTHTGRVVAHTTTHSRTPHVLMGGLIRRRVFCSQH